MALKWSLTQPHNTSRVHILCITGPQRIWTAGEFEHDTREKRHSEGGVVVPPVLLRDMQALRDYLPGMKEKYEKLSFEA